MKAWQIPISMQDRSGTAVRAHYFLSSRATNELARAECGLLVNPGFARPRGNTEIRCYACTWALASQRVKEAA